MFTSKILTTFLITTSLICATLFGAFVFVAHNKCIDFSVLENYNPGMPSIVLDDAGNEWTRFQLDRREPIKLEGMPQHLINAFIATEDWAFFSHPGFSWKGIVRAGLINLYHGRRVQGASTITQQLVKLLFFDSKKTFTRKIKEATLALIVEQQFTKEQILETYLNHVCFGCGIYGVQAASQRFWGKNAADITLDEAAALAGIVRAPGRYCPITAAAPCQKRRNVVLGLMRTRNFITADACAAMRAVPLTIKEPETSKMAPHARESLRLILEERVGKVALYSGGLTIQTTINKQAQQQAERCFSEQCTALKESLAPGVDGALITIEAKTGAIKALIGGYDFNISKFNRVNARRQMGSTFKPLIYAVALQQGMNFADTELDEPIEIVQGATTWRPKNAYKNFNGTVTLAHALSYSTNIVPIKLLCSIGFTPVINLAQKCRINGVLNPYPSLALGCVDVTLKEVVGMFNIFANDGVYIEPHMIKWIKDRWGTKIFKTVPQKERVLSSRIVGQVSKVLELGLSRVHKFYPQPWLECDGMSKTGTTNDSRTCWYTGSTPDYTTAVYIGLDNNSSMGKDIYPLNTAFPIWLGLMRSLPCTTKKFVRDASLKEVVIDEKSGRIVGNPARAHTMSILV